MKTTYVRITFGFDKNKFGQPKFYRKGKGINLADAIGNLFRQKGNNYLPIEQKNEIISQINVLNDKLEKLSS